MEKIKGEVVKYDKESGCGIIRSRGKELVFRINSDKKVRFQKGDVVEFLPKQERNGRMYAEQVKVLTCRLPADTADLLSNNQPIDNFSLKLNKAAHICQNKFSFDDGMNGSDFNIGMIEQLSRRLNSSLAETGWIVKSLVFQTDWRLAVGLGGASVYENSITLHHIYGFPYIPGSAVKGTVRSWIIGEYFGNDEKKALGNQGFCRIFGSPSNGAEGAYQGDVLFFDAYPVGKPTIKQDIMNPHYSFYYRKGNQGAAPRDDENPVPILFLTVENTKFQFLFAIRERDNLKLNDRDLGSRTLLDVVLQELPRALENQGIGAKTAVGYGYMSPAQ